MRLIDYYYEPHVAARVAAARLFVCPVAGAEEELRREQPGMPHLEWVFPPPEVLAKGHYFARLTQVQNAVCTEKFTSAVGL
jgi:spermidine/putrescine transport system substrate-binding protein